MIRVRAAVAAAALVAGCGPRESTSPPTDVPLSVARWKALPPAVKFEVDTLERLRQTNPELREQRDWDRFAKSVVAPALKRERRDSTP